MTKKSKQNLALAATLLIYCTLSGSHPAEAKKPQTKADPNALEVALKLPLDTGSLSLDIQNADFLLRHEDRADIEIRVNNRQNWQVDDNGVVKQSKVARCPCGIYTTQNGGTYVGMGTVELPDGKKGSISMTTAGITVNGRKLPTEKKVTKKDAHGLEMNTEGIFVNGRRVITNSNPKGFDNQLDNIQVVVPNNFKGSLNLNWNGSIRANMDSWSGEKLTVIANGSSALSINDIKSPYELVTNKTGKINVDNIKAEKGSIEASNEGKIEIQNSKCTEFDIRANDNAEITIAEGQSTNCTTTAKGTAKVNLGTNSDDTKFAFDAANVDLKSAGESYINLYNSSVRDCKVATSDKGKIRAHGAIAHLEEKEGSCGNVTVEMKTR
jgi:hypothetical protein